MCVCKCVFVHVRRRGLLSVMAADLSGRSGMSLEWRTLFLFYLFLMLLLFVALEDELNFGTVI